eukprot:snap_masked-scaffold_82-processed-gene-0.30-mRNA-1 protein AED:1.00 eAED:1.00 QI:0/-1/0/0/-1/1/1/0/338
MVREDILNENIFFYQEEETKILYFAKFDAENQCLEIPKFKSRIELTNITNIYQVQEKIHEQSYQMYQLVKYINIYNNLVQNITVGLGIFCSHCLNCKNKIEVDEEEKQSDMCIRCKGYMHIECCLEQDGSFGNNKICFMCQNIINNEKEFVSSDGINTRKRKHNKHILIGEDQLKKHVTDVFKKQKNNILALEDKLRELEKTQLEMKVSQPEDEEKVAEVETVDQLVQNLFASDEEELIKLTEEFFRERCKLIRKLEKENKNLTQQKKNLKQKLKTTELKLIKETKQLRNTIEDQKKTIEKLKKKPVENNETQHEQEISFLERRLYLALRKIEELKQK